MKFNNELDAMNLIEELNLENASMEELKEVILHLRRQFKTRYSYLVGEWQHAKRIKSTRDGQFISKDALIKYLES